MTDKYLQNFKSITSKIAEICYKTCQKQTLFTSYRVYTAIFLFKKNITDFDASKKVLESFFPFFTKILPKNIHHSSKSRNCFVWPCLPGDLRWLWPILMVTKHRKWYLQMSETIPMPIRWLCLSLTSKFCSPMWTSPKSQTFWLWPDLWRHW